MTIYIMELLDTNSPNMLKHDRIKLYEFNYDIKRTAHEYFLPNDYEPYMHDFVKNECVCLNKELEE